MNNTKMAMNETADNHFNGSEEKTCGYGKMERDLIDNILESSVKLGFADTSITFYYPETSLTELFECGKDELSYAVSEFRKIEKDKFGDIVFEELNDEKRRYAVKVSAEGTEWVHANFKTSAFIEEFVKEIKRPGNTLDDIAAFFRKFSTTAVISKNSPDEWALSFGDDNVDPYVYHIEQNVFGLEYHRFTKAAYRNMMENEDPVKPE